MRRQDFTGDDQNSVFAGSQVAGGGTKRFEWRRSASQQNLISTQSPIEAGRICAVRERKSLPCRRLQMVMLSVVETINELTGARQV